MVTKRIIPCLDVRNGRVVKGVNFLDVQDVSDPVRLADYYSRSGADELVFYDITASVEGRKLFTDILTDVASTIFIPLTVGGGISRLEDFERVLSCGADKVSVNSGAIQTPDLIDQAAKRYGDQCVVLSVDVKRVDGRFRVFRGGGRVDTGLDALEWIHQDVYKRQVLHRGGALLQDAAGEGDGGGVAGGVLEHIVVIVEVGDPGPLQGNLVVNDHVGAEVVLIQRSVLPAEQVGGEGLALSLLHI